MKIDHEKYQISIESTERSTTVYIDRFYTYSKFGEGHREKALSELDHRLALVALCRACDEIERAQREARTLSIAERWTRNRRAKLRVVT